MSSQKRIAVAGAGSLGSKVIPALVAAGYCVTVLTRSQRAADQSHAAEHVKYVTVDYDAPSSLEHALRGHHGLVTTITAAAVGQQDKLMAAAIAAGVQRFLPAEFGADMENDKARALPVFAGKVDVLGQLADAVVRHPEFSYTCVRNGVFLDWGLEMGFLMDCKERTALIFDSGDQPFSTITLDSVARAVVGVFDNLSATKNRAVYVQDAVVTQNELLAMAMQAGGQLKEWKLEHQTTEDIETRAFQVMKSASSPDAQFPAIMDFLRLSVYGPGYGGDHSSKIDNTLLHMGQLTKEEVKQIVLGYC